MKIQHKVFDTSKKISRFFSLLLSFIMIFALAACAAGATGENALPPENSADVAAASEVVPVAETSADVSSIKEILAEGQQNAQASEQFKFEMRSDITTMDLVKEMELGINLGNTMEACGDWIDSSSISNYERAWGSPLITEEIIAGYAKAGFKSLRVPVAWSNMMADDYTIHPDLLNRVEQIVNWGLDNGLIVMVNEHWDGGWWENMTDNHDMIVEKFESIWTQVSERFKDYGDRLMFEAMNEVGYSNVWNEWAPAGPDNDKAKAIGYVNELNQLFVDTVRASGGNNATRHLVIEGYYTNIDHSSDPLFKMPQDEAGRCALTVHYYDPPTFAIIEEDVSWGKAQSTWGTEEEIAHLDAQMEKMKTNFVDKGIPVIIGEFGAGGKNKTQEMIRFYEVSIFEAAYSKGMCPMLWDTPGGQYDRLLCDFLDPLFKEEVMAIRDKYKG
ncbi:MAG: glycoside hydrolase family 5 protein [Clostridiales bacterium]|nr:glycoside hydrolase family 5 protein [Clostridiales bacterium]